MVGNALQSTALVGGNDHRDVGVCMFVLTLLFIHTQKVARLCNNFEPTEAIRKTTQRQWNNAKSEFRCALGRVVVLVLKQNSNNLVRFVLPRLVV